MNISEKAAYFKGLVEGLGADRDSREGKLWLSLTDLLSDIAKEINELNDTSSDFADLLDEISEDLAYLEEITCDLNLPEDYEDLCSGDCASCGRSEFAEAEDGDSDDVGDVVAFSDYLEDGESEELPAEEKEPEYDSIVYDVTCPSCGDEITFDEDTLAKGFIICPNCGEKLEFDLDD